MSLKRSRVRRAVDSWAPFSQLLALRVRAVQCCTPHGKLRRRDPQAGMNACTKLSFAGFAIFCVNEALLHHGQLYCATLAPPWCDDDGGVVCRGRFSWSYPAVVLMLPKETANRYTNHDLPVMFLTAHSGRPHSDTAAWHLVSQGSLEVYPSMQRLS